MNGIKKKIEYLLKHNTFVQNLYKVTLSAFFKFIGLFVKTDINIVLINSFGGRRYNDSPKAISDFLSCNYDYNRLKIVWAFEAPEEFNIPYSKIKIDSWSYFITALKAKYWISNVNIERGLKFKKKKTRYLNTWHGTPLKLVGNAVSGRRDFDCSNVDIFCCSGQYEKDIFLRDFGVRNENLIYSGLPRNDELYDVDDTDVIKIKEKLKISNDKKVILYAPTWRDSVDKGKSYVIKPLIDLNKWRNLLNNQYIILFRAHSFTTKIMGLEFDDFIFDFSNYQSINELLKITDVLISDYSATIFDFSILKRPILAYAYDYDDYKKIRGFYIDLEKELPGGVIKNEDEVLYRLLNLDYSKESYNTNVFRDKYIEYGGNAIELCTKALFNSIVINDGVN